MKTLVDQAKDNLSPDSLLIILGPTASGKTALAVNLAEQLNGEIISADSRQVYRRMDIGTGKDLDSYGEIAYHLIDIAEPGDRYQVDRFRHDFFQAYDGILSRGKQPILCGGTGSYIQSILQQSLYTQIPKDSALQAELALRSKENLIEDITRLGIPKDYRIDFHNHKRLVRALEISLYLEQHDPTLLPPQVLSNYYAIGINPPLLKRREAIHQRLLQRLEQGLVSEVQNLLSLGLTHHDLDYYGLEYRYISLFLQGTLSYDAMVEKLKTEIQRYAKRQMTYFRKMEKDGISISWTPAF
ncbi:tRNA (adenosine(37)-N6)-dimethylallyltransferase MiaA [Sphingobacterium sp. lm-10]|uniref:tRNA (adenosine(37)-N6)-dimethylallyltransferase MiaA n=1 Tax=Sphingobacterium sp. lm-10 TaxID=2944904 RepID=UPI0020207ECE|nr:tRNA (adenosine(37)-N6)-dimethylallyltransferase MiaA [Sphingobacterium sp. lm-10]MCL7988241.1 tRNA (adenosine(37)-N6)-dimethylallyltransferase MiaA [Sphingobacterium sp. lm-10]